MAASEVRGRVARRAVVLCSLFLVSASTASAQPHARASANPNDDEQRRLAREVAREGRRPHAILPLLELWHGFDRASPGLTTQLVRDLARDRRLAPALRAYASALHGWALEREGDAAGAQRTFDELGYIRHYRVAGAFDNEGKAGFDREMPPETARNAPHDPSVEMQGRERLVRWRTMPDVARLGFVSFDAVLRPWENVCGFAETFVHVDRARPMSLWTGASGAVKVWFNGDLALSDATYRLAHPDRATALVSAREGWNRVLVKVCVAETEWGFYLRLAEADGSPPAGIRVDPGGATSASPPPSRPVRMPASAPAAALAALEAAVAADSRSARAHYDLARLLRWSDADDRDDRRARQLAERAAELDGRVEHWLLAASLADHRHERMRFVAAAAARDANDPRVILEQASLAMSGDEPERAFALLDRVPRGTRYALRATLVRSELLARFGLVHAAIAEVDRARPIAGDTVAWMRSKAYALGEAGLARQALDVDRAILALRPDDYEIRKRLVVDAMDRGDRDEATRHADVLRTLWPGSQPSLDLVASIYEGLGEDEALTVRREMVELVPDDADAHVGYGRALLRFGQREPAAAALRQALALRPQDAATRQLLEQIRPAARPDEALATDTAEILRRRSRPRGWSSTVLHDLRVSSAYENGLGSTFRQLVVQIHDTEAARRWRTYSVAYEGTSQWLEVRLARVYRADGSVLESFRTSERSLGDAANRIYYDTRAFAVTFPDLEPGDTIELRYRIDDVAQRNVFADYFGDLQVLQGSDPIVRLEYVLMTSASRELFFNEPRLRGIRHERRVEGGQRIDRFVAERVPPVRGEPHMPGATETLPYLHVSTYRTWEDVGRWWWGLIRDQLHVDASLERTVRELVRDAPDVRTKVARIFGWVAKNTRYVALEFGIHGFKPYRVQQVVARGFGDCKDKAALLYAMLRSAGIDARIALVRTRGNGPIGDRPASLAVFDHAIAYVPALDLYLDGTAENSGAWELPPADQGVTALVVGENGAELRTTPVLPPAANRGESRLVIRLGADGAAEIEGTTEVRGAQAAQHRATYEAPELRRERLQRALSQTYPGIELTQQSFEPLDDLERPVRYTYRARVPQIGERNGDDLQIAPSGLAAFGPTLAATPTRQHAMDLGMQWSWREGRSLEPRSGLEIAHVPPGGEARSQFGTLRVSYERSGNRIVATTELELTRDRIAPDEYAAFRAWTESADALLRQRITLRRSR